MTKPINIKKLEKEIEDISRKLYKELDKRGLRLLWKDSLFFGLEQQIKDLIKQIVESVPVEENVAGVKTTQWLIDYGMTDEDISTAGQVEEIVTNYHSDIVQEIKQWKEKILKELNQPS